MKHAFLSHASKDSEIARAIKAILEGEGVACWMAPDDIVPGRDYAEEIIRGIEETACTVLLLSRNANDSPFVKREIERAVSKKKPVFPVRLDDAMPSAALELFISSAHWVDAASGSLPSPILRLAESIRGLVGLPLPKPEPAVPESARVTPVAIQPVLAAEKEAVQLAAPPGKVTRRPSGLVLAGALLALGLTAGVITYVVRTPAAASSGPVTEVARPGPTAVTPMPVMTSEKPVHASEKAEGAHAAKAPALPAPVAYKVAGHPAGVTSKSEPPVATPGPGNANKCSGLLEKISLGEPLGDKELTFLKTQCK